jgi:uncharacterized protein YjgD (DUF1641 family)
MDETEPQLAYVAYDMTMHGQQKITKDKLEKSIIEARRALPELLDYTKVSPSIFIDQVEERSSLLIQSGLEENDKGRWVPSYEFSHLSFQEYLTAKAIAENWIPDLPDQEALEVLKPHINEDHWKEVIPLTAVLLGRSAKPLIEYLIESSETDKTINSSIVDADWDNMDSHDMAPLHLANCIAGEVPMTQDLLEKAMIIVVKRLQTIKKVNRRLDAFSDFGVLDTIVQSKYEDNFLKTVRNTLFNTLHDNYLYEFSEAWMAVYYFANEKSQKSYDIEQLLKSKKREEQITGALLLMRLAYRHCIIIRRHGEMDSRVWLNTGIDVNDKGIMSDIFSSIVQLLQTDDTLSIYSAAWCIAWSGYEDGDIIPYEVLPDIAKKLTELWLCNQFPFELGRVISWGLSSICMPNLPKDIFQGIDGLTKAIENNYLHPRNREDKQTAIHLAVLMDYWTRDEIQKRLDSGDARKYLERELSRFLQESGFHGPKEFK